MIQTYGFPSLGMLGVVCNLIVLALLKFAPFKDDTKNDTKESKEWIIWLNYESTKDNLTNKSFHYDDWMIPSKYNCPNFFMLDNWNC